MTNSRTKGAKGEREWANVLKEHGYEARRGQQYKGGSDSPDVIGLPGIHQEIKRVEAFRLYPSLEQSKRDAADAEIPIVVHRMNRKPWVVVMDAEDWLRLYFLAQHAFIEDNDEWFDKDYVRKQSPFEYEVERKKSQNAAEDDER